MSKRATQDEVHDIRTHATGLRLLFRLCNWIAAGRAAAVLRAVTPMRKKAGDVRDMDVLTGFAAPHLEKGGRAMPY